MTPSFNICVLGGTGAEGSGLAVRWAHKGHRVSIASRDAAKAEKVAAELNALLPTPAIAGMSTAAGAAAAEIAVLAVPFAAQMAVAGSVKDALRGKILIDVTVPLVPPKVFRAQLPEGGSCVVALQAMLGPDVQVVSAFQNVSAHKLRNVAAQIDCDVLVASDYQDARKLVISLVADAGLRGVDAGPLANSVVAEAMTSALIWINRTYKVPNAGVRITGIG